MKIAIACDHAGYQLKQTIIDIVRRVGHDVLDLGTDNTDPVDYPDYAEKIGQAILNHDAERGIMLCGSGVGACIALNKVYGIYAGLCHDTYSAHQCVEHDNVNVLCMGARVIGPEVASEIAAAGFATVSRIRRLAKLNHLVPELAENVEAGEISASLAFEIASLPAEAQSPLLEEEAITAETVRQAKYARRQTAIPDLADLVEEAQPPATFEDMIRQLSANTLNAMLAELPDEARFATWRAKFTCTCASAGKRALNELQFAQSIQTQVQAVS